MSLILMIDDDKDLAESAKIVLEGAGHRFEWARNGAEGLAKATELKPDLILLDVMMEQDDDGFVAAQEIRALGMKTPIVMLSNIGNIMGMTFGRDDEMAPVEEFTYKPIEPAALLELAAKYAGRGGKENPT